MKSFLFSIVLVVLGGGYTYYPDGSLKSDANRGINNIVYNYLGLVEKLELTNGRSIAYVFDADGQKLRKTIKETGKPDFVRFDVSMDYMGGLIYHDGKLISIDTPEGRAVPLDSTNQDFTYQFFYNDHLGNLRVAYSVAPNGAIITQENQSSATPIAQWANFWKELEAPKPPKGASKTIFGILHGNKK